MKVQNITYLVRCLVVHDELAVDEVETVRLCLERMVDHVLDYKAQMQKKKNTKSTVRLGNK